MPARKPSTRRSRAKAADKETPVAAPPPDEEGEVVSLEAINQITEEDIIRVAHGSPLTEIPEESDAWDDEEFISGVLAALPKP